MSVLSTLLEKADDAIYSGLKSLRNKPNGIGMSTPLFKERAKQRIGNYFEATSTGDLRRLLGRDNIKIYNAGGLGDTPMLQEIYERLTGRWNK